MKVDKTIIVKYYSDYSTKKTFYNNSCN